MEKYKEALIKSREPGSARSRSRSGDPSPRGGNGRDREFEAELARIRREYRENRRQIVGQVRGIILYVQRYRGIIPRR